MYKFTDADREKASKTFSVYRSLSTTLKKRKKCAPKCFFFEKCPFASISLTNPDKKCMMRAFPEKVKARFYKMFMGSEDELLEEIKTAIFNYGVLVDANASLREKREFIELMLKLHKAIYGDKTQVIDKEPLKINIMQVGGEKQLIDTGVDITPKPTQIKEPEFLESKKSIKFREKMMNECKEEIAVETDPESLFVSERLDDIIRGEK